MKQQTTVEWLEQVLNEKRKLTPVDFFQAKEMERQQIIFAYHNGCADQISVPRRGYKPDEYYEKTYKDKTLK